MQLQQLLVEFCTCSWNPARSCSQLRFSNGRELRRDSLHRALGEQLHSLGIQRSCKEEMLLVYNHSCEDPAKKMKFVNFLKFPFNLQTSVILTGFEWSEFLLQLLFFKEWAFLTSLQVSASLHVNLILWFKAVVLNCLLLFLQLNVFFFFFPKGGKKLWISLWRPLAASPKMFTKRANNLWPFHHRNTYLPIETIHHISFAECLEYLLWLICIKSDCDVRKEIWELSTNWEFLGKFLCSWNLCCLDCGMRWPD